MADCVSASIIIGGRVSPDDFVTLCRLIANEDLRIDEDGEPFTPEFRVEGEPLQLFDHQAIGGHFPVLELWCIRHGLPYSRWCAGYTGSWLPEREVFTGEDDVATYPANENGATVATREILDQHDSVESLRAWFAAADFQTPPLEIAIYDVPAADNAPRVRADEEGSGNGEGEPSSQLQKGYSA
jgi:hypothetical protein